MITITPAVGIEFGLRARAARRKLGLRPETVASACGLSVGRLYEMESGSPISAIYIPPLAHVLGVTTDYLLGMELPEHWEPAPRKGDKKLSEAGV